MICNEFLTGSLSTVSSVTVQVIEDYSLSLCLHRKKLELGHLLH